MATFAELVADVKTITNRPDLDTEIKLAVKVATLKAHHSDYYPKDLYESGIEWATPRYVQSFEYRTLIPRWRAFKYLRKYDSDDSEAGAFFTLIIPETVLDRYGVEKENVCYLAGEILEIKSSTLDEHMLLGCYRHPDITESTYSSFIALDHPHLIMLEASSKIFKMIGQEEAAAALKTDIAEQYMILKQEISAEGF